MLLVSSFTPLWLLTNHLSAQTFTALTVDDVQIQYDIIKKSDTSGNSPLVVLLHGFSGNRIMMRMIAQALATGQEPLEEEWERARQLIIELILAELERLFLETLKQICSGPATLLPFIWVALIIRRRVRHEGKIGDD